MADALLSRRRLLSGLAAATLAPAFGTSAAAQESDTFNYEELGMFPPIPPSAENNFYFYRFNDETKASHPDFSPLDLTAFHSDKFILLNFVDPAHRERSIVQINVLRSLANDLAPVVGPKEILVADVFVRDSQGNDLYAAEYEALHESNQLGRDQSYDPNHIVPYGVAFSKTSTSPDASIQRLMDFSVSRFNPSEEQMKENIGAIAGNLSYYARQANPDHLPKLKL